MFLQLVSGKTAFQVELFFAEITLEQLIPSIDMFFVEMSFGVAHQSKRFLAKHATNSTAVQRREFRQCNRVLHVGLRVRKKYFPLKLGATIDFDIEAKLELRIGMFQII